LDAYIKIHSGDPGAAPCSLYLSIMDRSGVKLDRFRDADKQLADLWS
jgi:hypothetical protein